jgi:hypothetical protein
MVAAGILLAATPALAQYGSPTCADFLAASPSGKAQLQHYIQAEISRLDVPDVMRGCRPLPPSNPAFFDLAIQTTERWCQGNLQSTLAFLAQTDHALARSLEKVGGSSCP